MATEPQRAGGIGRGGWARGVAVVVAGLGLGPTAAAQQVPRLQPAEFTTDLSKRPVAYIYSNMVVSREELGEYLIARGGMEKLDLLVNKDVIEYEAARRRQSVTSIEIEAGLQEELAADGLTPEQFVQNVLPRYGKSLYEWEQDVIRPRLLLAKIARDRVTVTDDDLKRAYENKYGEQREAHVIVWPKGQGELTEAQKAAALVKPEEFADLARRQPNDLAASEGRAKPEGRHGGRMDPAVEGVLFGLQVGEAKWVESAAASTCIKCAKVSAPAAPPPPDQVRPALEKDVRDRKLTVAIVDVLRDLKAAANPTYTTQVPARPQADAAAPARIAHPDPRVLAVIYKDVLVTRADLGEFLIARGGYQKVDLLVNRRIIEIEATRRGVTVTPDEVDANLVETLKATGLYREGPGLTPDDALRQVRHDFVTKLLPRYGKTLFEYTEDVIKPQLAMRKMCGDRVKVTDEDIQKAFESLYGEKRDIRIVIWPRDEQRSALRQWDKARKGDAEFDEVARGQKDPNLAAGAGKVSPVGRHVDADSPKLEEVLFGYTKPNGEKVRGLPPGELSQLFETPAGIVCVKCVGVIPATPGVTPEAVRASLQKAVYEKKLAKEIPLLFAEMRQKANPNVLLKGPPSPEENAAGVQQLIQRVGATMPAPK